MSNRSRQKIRLFERHRQWELRLEDKSADHDCNDLERGLQSAGRLVFSAISTAMQTAGEQLESYALAHDGPRPSPDVWRTLGARDRMLTPRTYGQHLVQRVDAAMTAGGDTLVSNAVTVKGVANVGPDSNLIFVFVPMTSFFTQPDIAYTMTDLTSRIFVPADLEGAIVPKPSLEPGHILEAEEEKPPSEHLEEEKPPSVHSEEEKPPSEHSEEEKPPSVHSEEEKPPSEHSEEEKPPSEHSEEEKLPSEHGEEDDEERRRQEAEDEQRRLQEEEEERRRREAEEEERRRREAEEEEERKKREAEEEELRRLREEEERRRKEAEEEELRRLREEEERRRKEAEEEERRRREAEEEELRRLREEEERRRREAEEEELRRLREEEERRRMEEEATPAKIDVQLQTGRKRSSRGSKVTVVYTESKKKSLPRSSMSRSPSPDHPKTAVSPCPHATGSKSPDRPTKVTVNLVARPNQPGASSTHPTPSPPEIVSPRPPTPVPTVRFSPTQLSPTPARASSRPPTPGPVVTFSPTPTAASPRTATPGPTVSRQQIVLQEATSPEQPTHVEVIAVRSPSPSRSPDEPSTSSLVTEDHIFMTSTSASPRSTVVEKFDIKYIREEIFDGTESRLPAAEPACVDYSKRRSSRSQSLSPQPTAGHRSSRKSSGTRSASGGRRHRSPSQSPAHSPISIKSKSSYSVSQPSDKSHSRSPSVRSPGEQLSPKVFISNESQVSDSCQVNDMEGGERSRPPSAVESLETDKSNSRSQSPVSEGHYEAKPIVSYSSGSLTSDWWMDETLGRESPSKSPAWSVTPSRKTDGYGDKMSELACEEGEYVSPPVSPFSCSSATGKTTLKETSALDEGTFLSWHESDSQKEAMMETERGSPVDAVSLVERMLGSPSDISEKIQSPLAEGDVDVSYHSDSDEKFEDSSGALEHIEEHVTLETLSPAYSDKESCMLQFGIPRSPTFDSFCGESKTRSDLQLTSPSPSRQQAHRIKTSTSHDFEMEKANICDEQLAEEQPSPVLADAVPFFRQLSPVLELPPHTQESEACLSPTTEAAQLTLSSRSGDVETGVNAVKTLTTPSTPDKIKTAASPIVEDVERAVLQLKMDSLSSMATSPNLDEIRTAISPAMQDVEKGGLQHKMEILSSTLQDIEKTLSPSLLERGLALLPLKIKTEIPVSPQHFKKETSPKLFGEETSPVILVVQTTTPTTFSNNETAAPPMPFTERVSSPEGGSTETTDSIQQSTYKSASHLEPSSQATALFRQPTPEPAVSPLQTTSEAASSLKKLTPESSVSSRQPTPAEEGEAKRSPTVGDETYSPPSSVLEAFTGLGSQILEYFKNSYFREGQTTIVRSVSSPSASESGDVDPRTPFDEVGDSADFDPCAAMDELGDKVGEAEAKQTDQEKKAVKPESLPEVPSEEVSSFPSSRASQKSRGSPCQLKILSPTIESVSSGEGDSSKKTPLGNTEDKHTPHVPAARSIKPASSSSSITPSESTASAISMLSPTSSPPEERRKVTPVCASGSPVQRLSLATTTSASQQPIDVKRTSHKKTSPPEALSCADLPPSRVHKSPSRVHKSREKIRSSSAQLADVSSQHFPRSYSPASSIETSPWRQGTTVTTLSPRITLLLSELRAALTPEPERSFKPYESNDFVVYSSSAGASPRRGPPISLHKERVLAATSPKSMAELLAAQRKKAKGDLTVRAASSTQTKRTVSEGLKKLVAAQKKHISTKSQQHSRSKSKERTIASKSAALEQITSPRSMLLLPIQHVSTPTGERFVPHDCMLPASTVTITKKKITYTAKSLPRSPADSVGMISPPKILSYPTDLPISLPQPIPIPSRESAQRVPSRCSPHGSPRSRGSPTSRRFSEPTHQKSPIIAPQQQTTPGSHRVSTIPSSFSSFRTLHPASAPAADPRFTAPNTHAIITDQRSPAFRHLSEYGGTEILGAPSGSVSNRSDNVLSANEKRKKLSKASGSPQKSVASPKSSELTTVFDKHQNVMEAPSHGQVRHSAVSRDRKTNAEEMVAAQRKCCHNTLKERFKKSPTGIETGRASFFRNSDPDPKGISSDSSEDFSIFVSKFLNDNQKKPLSPQASPTSHTAPLSPGRRRIPDAVERQRLLEERRKRNKSLGGHLRATVSTPSASPLITSPVHGRSSSPWKSPSVNPGNVLGLSPNKSPRTKPGNIEDFPTMTATRRSPCSPTRNNDFPVFQETPLPLSQQLQSYRHRQGLVGDSAERFSFSRVQTSPESQPFTAPSTDTTPDQYKQIRRVSWNDNSKLRHIYQNRSCNQNTSNVLGNSNDARNMSDNGSTAGSCHNATWNVDSDTSCPELTAVGSFTIHSVSPECCRDHSGFELSTEKCPNSDHEEIIGTYSCKAGTVCKENKDNISSGFADTWECDTKESSKEATNWKNMIPDASETDHLTRRFLKETQQRCQKKKERLQTDIVQPELACTSSAKHGENRESEETSTKAANQQNLMSEASNAKHVKRRFMKELQQRQKEGTKSPQTDDRVQPKLAGCLAGKYGKATESGENTMKGTSQRNFMQEASKMDPITRRFMKGFESNQIERGQPELAGISFSKYGQSTEREQPITEAGSQQNMMPGTGKRDHVTRRLLTEIQQRWEYTQKCYDQVAVAVEDRHQLQEVIGMKDTTHMKTLQSQSRHLTIKHKKKCTSMTEERSHMEEYIIKTKQGTSQNREGSDSRTAFSSRKQENIERHQACRVQPKVAGSPSAEHAKVREDQPIKDRFKNRMHQQQLTDISKHKEHEPLSLSEELRNAGWSPEPHLGILRNKFHDACGLERHCSDEVPTGENTGKDLPGSCSGRDFQNVNTSANSSLMDSGTQGFPRGIIDKKLHGAETEDCLFEQESLHNIYENAMKTHDSYISFCEDEQDVLGVLDEDMERHIGSETEKEVNLNAVDECGAVYEWNRPKAGDCFPQLSKHFKDEDSETQHESMLLHQHSGQWAIHNINNSGNDESQTAHTPTVQAGKKGMLKTSYENKIDYLGWTIEEPAGAVGGQGEKEESKLVETKGMLKSFPRIRSTVLRKRRSFGRSYLARLLNRQRGCEGEHASDCDGVQQPSCRMQSNDYIRESDLRILERESIACKVEEGGDTEEAVENYHASESLESNFEGESRVQFKGLRFHKDQSRGECTCNMDASTALPLRSQRRFENLKVHFNNGAALGPCFDQASFVHDECHSNDADGIASDYEPGEVLHSTSTCSCDCSALPAHSGQIQTSSFLREQFNPETGAAMLCEECGKWNIDDIAGCRNNSEEHMKSFHETEDIPVNSELQMYDVELNRQMDVRQDVNVPPRRCLMSSESDHFHHTNYASPPGTTTTSSHETGHSSSHSEANDPTDDNANVIVSDSMIQAYGYNPMTESPFVARGYPELQQEITSLDHISVPFVKRKALVFLRDEKEEFVEVGRGTYGCVYLAQAATRRGTTKVVVKDFFTDSTSWDLIIHEAQMLCYLEDTGVIPHFYGLLKRRSLADDFSLIQQYFGQGKTLHTVIVNKEPLPPLVWQDIAWQLGRGLLLIHERHVLLNDLKGDNVLIDLQRERKVVKYIDLGMATFRKGLNFHLPKDQMSKFNFLAPEVRAGAFTSPMSDVFSLGYLLDQINRLARLELLRYLCTGCMESIPSERLHLPDVVDALELQSHDLRGVCYAAAAGGEPSLKAASASQTDKKLRPLLV